MEANICKKSTLIARLITAVLLYVCALSCIAAEFELTTLDNQPTRLDQYVGQGKWVLLMLWASDCTICMQQEPAISAFHDSHQAIDAIVVGISIDGHQKIDAVNAYLDRFKPNFTNLVGELDNIAASYQSATQEQFLGTPTYLLYTPEGKLVGNNPGPLKTSAIERFIEKRSRKNQ